MIPEFAVLGHPNEGKSSVVSTLTENDQISVSPIPGETMASRTYTVRIDNEEIIRFIDTPGFQVPRQTLDWFRSFEGDSRQIIRRFIDTHHRDEFFADEVELLGPVARGAGIIYVVDGSRPVRPDDLAEMEILRLTGRPRMAVINCKNALQDYTGDWRQEFRRHFNAVRLFNSNTANFTERIKMLESLKAIDQEWESSLTSVIRAFETDWKKRNRLAASHITETMSRILSHTVSQKIDPSTDRDKIRKDLSRKYQEDITQFEQDLFRKIRQLYRHNLYEVILPEYSVLQYDLFSKQTWEMLGLTREQLATAGAVIGGTFGAVMDTAAAGITFGVFTAIGGAIGAGSALWGGRKMTAKNRYGFRLGSDRLQLGPNKNLQMLYILIDRVLIYYSLMINRPHGRRDSARQPGDDAGKKGFSTQFTSGQRKVCARFFKAVNAAVFTNGKDTADAFERLIESVLMSVTVD